MKSYSQAAQDVFVRYLLGDWPGKFIDIGCCHPTELSNTFALEASGWRGLLVDNDPGAAALCRQHRKSRVIEGDATKVDWLAELPSLHWSPGAPIDYLSLDVDAATLAVLQSLPLNEVWFQIITIEHDKYRFGPGPQDAMRRILRDERSYDLVCADVCSADGQAFEDWYVCRNLSRQADPIRCEGKRWTEIFQ